MQKELNWTSQIPCSSIWSHVRSLLKSGIFNRKFRHEAVTKKNLALFWKINRINRFNLLQLSNFIGIKNKGQKSWNSRAFKFKSPQHWQIRDTETKLRQIVQCALTVAENPQKRWKNCRDFYHAFFILKCHKGWMSEPAKKFPD